MYFTVIYHEARKKLKLAVSEYVVADVIYHLANNPKNQLDGWCNAKQETIAMMLGFTKDLIYEIEKRLLKKDIIVKDGHLKKTTKKWYEAVITPYIDNNSIELSNKKIGKNPILEKQKKSGKTRPYNNKIYTNNNYNNNINNNTNNSGEEILQENEVNVKPSEVMKSFINAVKNNTQEYKNLLVELEKKKEIPVKVAEIEIQKFIEYWTELNKSGKKQKWELQETFEVSRRLATWFRNFQKFNQKKKGGFVEV
jgi:hypothetical protein